MRPGTFQAVDLTEPSIHLPIISGRQPHPVRGQMFWTSLEPGMPSPTRWIDQNVLELKSRAPTCARKLTRKRQEGTSGEARRRPEGEAAESCGLRRGASWRSRPSKCTLPWTPTPSGFQCFPPSYPLWPNKMPPNCSTRGRETAHARTPKKHGDGDCGTTSP